MAKKEEKAKTVLERVYNVPLRKEFQKAPPYKRAKKAVKALREFIAKHMKSENVIIGRYANQFLWKDGIQKPPHHVRVNAVKDEKGRVTVELAELPAKAKRELEKEKQLKKKGEEAKKEEKKEEAKKEESKAEKIEEKAGEAEKEKEEKAKGIEKEEIKELKKEHPKAHAPKPQAIPKEIESHPSGPRHL